MPLMETMPRTTLRRELRWVVASRYPRGWGALVERCGGRPFHSPARLATALVGNLVGTPESPVNAGNPAHIRLSA